MPLFKNIIKNTFFRLYKVIFLILGKCILKNSNIVIFESFLGKQYSDNPRAIYEYLREYYPMYTLIWSADREAVPKFQVLDIKSTKGFSLNGLFLLNRANIWCSKGRMPF